MFQRLEQVILVMVVEVEEDQLIMRQVVQAVRES
jgi:hypothetical protein